MTFDIVELYCGLGAVTLAATGCSPPPVSRVGAKTGYVVPILRELGVTRGGAKTALVVDIDPFVVATLCALLSPAGRRHIARILDSLRVTDARAVWRAAAEHVKVPLDAAAAKYAKGSLEPALWLLYTAGARGGVGGFKGAHKLRPNVDGFIPSRASLIERVKSFRVPDSVTITVKLATAGAIDPVTVAPTAVYLDPPYDSSELLHHRLGPQPPPIQVAEQWRRDGHRVVLSSEAPLTRLQPPSWRSLSIHHERVGQVRRSLVTEAAEWLAVGAP